MATKLFLRDAATSGIGVFRDLSTTAGSGVAPLGEISTTASGTEIQWKNNGQVELLEWISGRAPSGGFTLAGTMTFSIWARENNMNANCGARARVFKRTAAGSESEVAGGPYNDGVEFGTVAAEMVWTGTPTSTAFAEDDRLIVRYYITNVGTMAGGYVCSMDYGAADATTGDSFFQINENVTFKANTTAYTMTADAGSYALTGTAATLKAGRAMAAVPGSYALTGTAADLKTGRGIAAAPGAYALTGTAALLTAQKRMAADVGSYTLTGTAAGLRRGITVVATPGSYSLTGTATGLLHGWRMAADVGSYILTGTAVGLAAQRKMAAAVGSYIYTGTAANLIYGGSGGYTMPAAVGSYTLTGTAAGLAAQRKMAAEAGSYALTGTAALLVRGRTMTAAAGAYALTGTPAGLSHGWLMVAESGAYALTGTPATFTALTGRMVANPGFYFIEGTTLAYVAPVLPARKESVEFKVHEPEVIRVQKLQTVADYVVPVGVEVYSMVELDALRKAMGLEAHCHDAPGGYVPVFCDGVRWRRATDRTVVV